MKQIALPPREHLPTRAEAAKYLGVSVPTLARWASTGNGPAYYVIGGKARYRVPDLDAYLESCRRASRTRVNPEGDG
jgi:excisionase family DNA binding protein